MQILLDESVFPSHCIHVSNDMESMQKLKKEVIMKKKNIIDELIALELLRLNDLLDVLEAIGPKVPGGYSSESDAYCWFDENPSHAEKKKVLTALGYDVSML